MSQHDLNIANQGFPAFRADLNDALVALGSTNSGATAPATTYANQLWYDTANNILKIRNEDNDAWISLLTLNQTADSVSEIATAIATLGAGSASNPALTTAGDTNTGIFFPAADTIAFAEGGVEVMRIDNAGNIGVGTTSPNTKFDVNGLITGRNGIKVTSSLASLVATSTVFLEQDTSASSRILATGADAGTSPTFSTVLLNNAGGVFGATTLSETGLAVRSLGIGGTTPSSSGTGITFPATQSASSNANTLDDYEEGSFTPTFTSGLTSVVYATQTGKYTKIGNLVHFQLILGLTSANRDANIVTISGLPFASSSSPNTNGGAFFVYVDGGVINSTSTNLPCLYIPGTGTTIQYYATNGGSFVGNNFAASNPSNYICGSYLTA
jgi:hypothetical protein